MIEALLAMIMVLVLLCMPFFLIIRMLIPSSIREHVFAYLIHDLIRNMMHRMFGYPIVRTIPYRRKRRRRR